MSASAPKEFTGPVFGLTESFQGCGVVLDTYDNDNRRNNPSVFILCNRGRAYPFDHDGDYERDMITTKPSTLAAGSVASAHKCVADVRNTGRQGRLLWKVVDGVAHVYLDQGDSLGYRFCLAVELPTDIPLKSYHIAMTGATGGVSDNVDIQELTTRYLVEGLYLSALFVFLSLSSQQPIDPMTRSLPMHDSS